MFLFDTDHLVIIQQRAEPEFNRLSIRISGRSGDEFFAPIITFHEQVQGWNAYINRAKRTTELVKGYARLQRILSDFSQARIAPSTTMRQPGSIPLGSSESGSGPWICASRRLHSFTVTHCFRAILSTFKRFPASPSKTGRGRDGPVCQPPEAVARAHQNVG
jgi:tRNA(fMet)-specific endonuclease VapC